MDSASFQNANCNLIFVGAPVSVEYGLAIEQEVARRNLGKRVKITGWVEDQSYGDYLAACDLAVQLRTESRGESSLALLDCLAHGIPTIANANGSTAELPETILCLLPDRFDQEQLRESIDLLLGDGGAATAMRESAQKYVQNEHAPAFVARRYHEEIERLYGRTANLTGALMELAGALSPEEGGRLAKIASASTDLWPSSTIYLDVSELADLAIPDARKQLLNNTLWKIAETWPRSQRLELIRYDSELNVYVKAHRCLAALSPLSEPLAPDEPVDFSLESTLLCLDGRQEAVTRRSQSFEDLYLAGVRTFFLIDDLRDRSVEQLPSEQISQVFENWLETVAGSSGAICSSESLAGELVACLDADRVKRTGFRVTCAQNWLNDLPQDPEQAKAMRAIVDQVIGLSAGSGGGAQERRRNLLLPREAEFLH
jgi:hypothetical protein